MNLRTLTFTTLAVVSVPFIQPAAAADLLYTLTASTTLPSSDTDWDYIKMQPGSSRLFLARDKDGLTVFDVDANKVVATVGNSVGANGPLLLPEYDRGYAAMTDGSFISFELESLKPIERLALDQEGGLNSAVHDPVTRRIHAIVSTREKQSTWYTLDAATGKLLTTTKFPFRKMDDPASDGKGRLFAPARKDNLILILDSKTLSEKGRWQVDCNVSKVRYQARTNRLLAACVGDEPSFLALDATTGRKVAQLPIGRGIDGFVIDEQRHRIVTSSGTDGILTVIGQSGADAYKLLGTVGTRSGARMMTLDERTGRLFVVNADYTDGAPGPDGSESRNYHPDSFVVLTYSPQ